MSEPATLRSPADVERLVSENLGIVGHCLKKFRRNGDRDELQSAGQLALWRAAELYDGADESGASFGTYAFRAVRRRMAQAVERSRDVPAVPLFDGIAARAESPSAPAERREAAELTGQLLAGLPPRPALVLRRLYLDGLSVPALADEMGLTRQRVGRLRDRALHLLRCPTPPPLPAPQPEPEPPRTEAPHLLRAGQVAGRLSVCVRTLWRMVERGDFPPPQLRANRKLVRWSSAAVDAWLAALLVPDRRRA